MGFFGKLFGASSKSTSAISSSSKATKPTLDEARMCAIVDHLQKNTAKPVIRIETQPVENGKPQPVHASKLGGLPYWPNKLSYPCGTDGKPLLLLAQINLSDIGICASLLPDDGMLQFFIAPDNLYGCDFDDMTAQKSFRVVLHDAIDPTVSSQSVRALGIRGNVDLDRGSDPFPFYREYSLKFHQGTECINLMDERGEAAINDALDTLFGQALNESIHTHFSNSECEYLHGQLGGWGTKLLGYPAFTQEDPRSLYIGARYPYRSFDTLLLQIDSDCNEIIWGDNGVCNFFISEKSLMKRDFSHVLYTWDCY